MDLFEERLTVIEFHKRHLDKDHLGGGEDCPTPTNHSILDPLNINFDENTLLEHGYVDDIVQTSHRYSQSGRSFCFRKRRCVIGLMGSNDEAGLYSFCQNVI
jgi:hypothetical protein